MTWRWAAGLAVVAAAAGLYVGEAFVRGLGPAPRTSRIEWIVPDDMLGSEASPAAPPRASRERRARSSLELVVSPERGSPRFDRLLGAFERLRAARPSRAANPPADITGGPGMGRDK